jgi:hypothetical protein
LATSKMTGRRHGKPCHCHNPTIISFCCQQHHPFTTDAPNETTNQHISPNPVGHVPDAPDIPAPLVVHVPDFKDPALLLAITSGDFEPCKNFFLDSDWITPNLRRHVESLFPGREAIDNGTGVRDMVSFLNELALFSSKKDAYMPLPNSSSRSSCCF